MLWNSYNISGISKDLVIHHSGSPHAPTPNCEKGSARRWPIAIRHRASPHFPRPRPAGRQAWYPPGKDPKNTAGDLFSMNQPGIFHDTHLAHSTALRLVDPGLFRGSQECSNQLARAPDVTHEKYDSWSLDVSEDLWNPSSRVIQKLPGVLSPIACTKSDLPLINVPPSRSRRKYRVIPIYW